MRPLSLLSLALSISAISALPSGKTPSKLLKFLPLGDRVTADSCWRAITAQRLSRNHGITLDFVGSQTGPSSCGTYDSNHESLFGRTATGLASSGAFPGLLAAAQPDIVGILLGTEDLLANINNLVTIRNAYIELVAQVRAYKPTTRILFSYLTPLYWGRHDYASRQTLFLNAVINQWVTTVNTTASPVFLVDSFNSIDSSTALKADGVLPTSATEIVYANRWESALVAAVNSF